MSTDPTGPEAGTRPSRSSTACVVPAGSSSRWWVTSTVASAGCAVRSSALHGAVVAAAHNPVLSDLFAEFVPVLREGLVTLLDLTRLRHEDANTGDDTHAALVHAVAEGDADRAAAVLLAELEQTLERLRGRR